MGTKVKVIEDPTKTCKLGQGSPCCVYLTLGKEGFTCEKNSGSSIERTLRKRYFSGLTNAKGTGEWEGCIWT